MLFIPTIEYFLDIRRARLSALRAGHNRPGKYFLGSKKADCCIAILVSIGNFLSTWPDLSAYCYIHYVVTNHAK